MGQQSMDKPPTKAKPSAEAEEAPDELDARLRQLAQDSFAAFYRERASQPSQVDNSRRRLHGQPVQKRKENRRPRGL